MTNTNASNTQKWDIHILGLNDAEKFIPTKPTYAIRAFSPGFAEMLDQAPLVESLFYRHTDIALFDDCWPGFRDEPGSPYIMITDSIAAKILVNFRDHSQGCEALLVHCMQGKNRSPAVAIALNEIFQLGQNTDELKRRYRESTWYAYNKLLDVASQIGLRQ